MAATFYRHQWDYVLPDIRLFVSNFM